MRIADRYSRALVTGGAGFIGSHIVGDLLAEGIEVISVDNYLSGKRKNLAPFRDCPSFTEVECDVCDYRRLRQYFEDVDIVFHEAASKKTICMNDPRRDLAINGCGTFNILELAREFSVKKLVHASTGSVYGEPQYFPQDEKHPLNPVSYYGVSKLAGERYALAFCHLYDLDVTVLRYFHVYGPRQDCGQAGGVVPIFGRQVLENTPISIFGDGGQQRSFTYVKDIVRINKLVAVSQDTKGEVYNCASGIRVTIRELAEAVRQSLGKPNHPLQFCPWQPGDIKVFDVDNSKVKSLGFEFQTGFELGLGETLKYLQTALGT